MAGRPLDDCVHCGFCLPVCPTWNSWTEEMDSPRGRIDLARALDDGRIALAAGTAARFDRCLGCMACVGACPSGVRYDLILADARVLVERELRRPLAERLFRGLIFALFPHPARLRAAALLLWLLRAIGVLRLLRAVGLFRLFPRLAVLAALAPDVGWRNVASSLPRVVPARGPRRLRAGLLGGCVQRVFFPSVNEATLRVLAAEGIEVVVPAGQGCCGALSAHSGRREEAARMARDLVLRFEATAVDAVVVNAAGCGSHLKRLAEFFPDDPAFAARAAAFSARVRDVHEVLASLPAVAPRGPFARRVAYHSSCHLGHAQGVQRQPRDLLRGIPGLELVEVPNGDECCGSAGIYNLVEPASAAEIGRRKAAAVRSTGAALLASPNPGCTLHILRMVAEAGGALEALHPVEILDESIRAGGDGRA